MIIIALVGTALHNYLGAFTENNLGINEPLTSYPQNMMVSASYGDYTPPISGDWAITTHTRVENVNYILNGSIIISANQRFEVMNCSFHFNASETEIYGPNNTTIYFEKSNLSSSDGLLAIGDHYNILPRITINRSILANIQSLFARDMLLESSEFYNFSGHYFDCIQIFNNTHPLSISRGTFENFSATCLNPVYVQNLTIESCLLQEIARNGIDMINSSNITIYNTLIRSSVTFGGEFGIGGSQCSDIKIENLTTQNFPKSTCFNYFNQTSVNNCTFENIPSDPSPGDGEVQIEQCTDFNITNCITRDLLVDGIEIYYGRNILVENNTIANIGTAFHIRKWPIYNLTIRNNTILSSADPFTGGCVISNISGLIIEYNDFQHSHFWVGSSSDVIIRFNTFDNQCVVFYSDLENYLIEDNFFREDVDCNDDPDKGIGIITLPFLLLGLLRCIVYFYPSKYAKKEK